MIGIFVMLLYVARRFEKVNDYSRSQTNTILLLIVISLAFALGTSFLFDGIFHTIAEGKPTFGSVTFIGGLAGGLVAFIILMKFFYKDDNKDMRKILNTVITGVVVAHAFGRIGCFFAGCCYGIPTDTFLGVVFPQGHAAEAFPGIAVFPTQLFESAFLFILFILLNKIKSFQTKELEIYLIGYGTWRLLVEFIRGDDRGTLFGFITTEYNVFPTPSQYLSLLMIIIGIYLLFKRKRAIVNPEEN